MSAVSELDSTRRPGGLETSVKPPPAVPMWDPTTSQVAIHGDASMAHALVVRSVMRASDYYLRSSKPDEWLALAKEAAKIGNCCRKSWAMRCEDTGEVVPRGSCCRSRHCPHCSRERSQRIRTQALAHARLMDSPKFITLTLRHRDQPLKQQIVRLLKSFRKFRQTPVWKQKVKGGLFVIEVTWNPREKQWHPHLHIIADAKYWVKEQLSRVWNEVTGDSFVVDIERPRSQTHVAQYVAKYVSKTNSPKHVEAREYGEWILAVRGLRMVNMFGSHHGLKWEPENEKTPGNFERLAPLAALESKRTTCPTAAGLLEAVLHPEAKPKANASPQNVVKWEQTNYRLAKELRAWYMLYLHKPEPPTKPPSTPRRASSIARGGFPW